MAAFSIGGEHEQLRAGRVRLHPPGEIPQREPHERFLM
nr:MAG TPA: hypothetical protein [Caudoviricetes sp.]